MKKRILSMILVVVLLLSCVPFVSVSAATSEKISFTSLTHKAYRSQTSKDKYDQRSWGNDLSEVNKGLTILQSTNADSDKGGSISYKALSRVVSSYYPAIYLDGNGNLVRDTSYDGRQVDVNLSDYLANGVGKYYGYFKLELADCVNLDTFTVYNKNNDWHQNNAFDVFVSANGTTWTFVKAFTNMNDDANWDGEKNIDDNACLYKTVDMEGVEAKYIAVAFPELNSKGQYALWYAEATKRVEVEVTEMTVSTVDELKNAIALGNTKTDFTIKLGSDLVCADDTNFGNLTGTGLTIDGQGHTIYNMRKGFGNIEGEGITLKNIVFSGKVSEDGGNITTGAALFGWISGASSTKPVVLENVTTQRHMTSIGEYTGGFTKDTWGTVVFRNCVNEGSLTTTTGGNWKVGGFVGIVNDGVTTIFESCVNKADVYASQAGGFVGIYKPKATIRMTDCANSGTITGFANGSGYGIAGGFIGSVNNGGDVGENTLITLTGCTNSGNVLVDSTASNSKANAIGGFIGHAGNVNSNATYEIIIDNCAVYNCSIDAIDSDNAHGTFYAAAFIGKISPQSDPNLEVLAKNSYVSKVSISAGNARKFVGVGSHTVNAVSAENCVVNELVEVNANGEIVEWNASAMAGCTRTFSADATTLTGFTDTDVDNMISAGGNGAIQTDIATGSTDIRFIATLPEGVSLEDYEKAGFYIVALTSASTDGYTDRVWIKNTDRVYSSLLANNEVTTAAEICSGAECLFTTEIQGIEQMIGVVDFYVTPYVIANDGSIIFGQSYTTAVDTGSYSVNPIKLLSYNLKDGEYNGESALSRKSGLANVVKGQEPEIVCLQELGDADDFYHFTVSSFAFACDNTTYAYHQAGTTAVMWDSALYTLEESGYVDCTVSGGDGYSRECAWVLLKRIEDGATFYVVSAHFDMNKPNDSASILANYFGSATRVIVAGDFNADETRKSVQNTFASANYVNAYTDFTNALAANSALQDNWNHDDDGYPADYGLDATFTNGTILDWCYIKGGFNVSEFEVVTSAGTTVSDHYPIYATLTLK